MQRLWLLVLVYRLTASVASGVNLRHNDLVFQRMAFIALAISRAGASSTSSLAFNLVSRAIMLFTWREVSRYGPVSSNGRFPELV